MMLCSGAAHSQSLYCSARRELALALMAKKRWMRTSGGSWSQTSTASITTTRSSSAMRGSSDELPSTADSSRSRTPVILSRCEGILGSALTWRSCFLQLTIMGCGYPRATALAITLQSCGLGLSTGRTRASFLCPAMTLFGRPYPSSKVGSSDCRVSTHNN